MQIYLCFTRCNNYSLEVVSFAYIKQVQPGATHTPPPPPTKGGGYTLLMICTDKNVFG